MGFWRTVKPNEIPYWQQTHPPYPRRRRARRRRTRAPGPHVTHVPPAVSRLRYAARSLERSIAAFREYRPGEEEERRAVIARLESKDWRGQQVFRVECDGDFGRGPHTHWVPEYILWGLIDVTRYRCPFHR